MAYNNYHCVLLYFITVFTTLFVYLVWSVYRKCKTIIGGGRGGGRKITHHIDGGQEIAHHIDRGVIKLLGAFQVQI